MLSDLPQMRCCLHTCSFLYRCTVPVSLRLLRLYRSASVSYTHLLNLLVEKITERRNEAKRSQWNQDSLENYFLFRYLCQGNADLVNKISGKINIDRWDQIRGLFLIESEDNFFEESEEVFIQKLTE